VVLLLKEKRGIKPKKGKELRLKKERKREEEEKEKTKKKKMKGEKEKGPQFATPLALPENWS